MPVPQDQAVADPLEPLEELFRDLRACSGWWRCSIRRGREITVLRQVTFGAPRSALLTAAAEAQLIVVGSRGLGGVEGMSLGSVAGALVHHSPCPVGVAHPSTR